MLKAPLSTYRAQLNKNFTFRDLHDKLEYLAGLGIDWIYASPVTAAVPGSSHGYDVTDFNALNPDLGTERDWAALHERRRSLGMGWLQDFVPNHMAYHLANPWVTEVLKHGEASTVAKHFDIDWRHPDFRGKVMLPILGAPLEEVVGQGHIQLDITKRVLRVYDRSLPLSARSLSRISDSGEVELKEVIAAQHYALTDWKATNSVINYRRFFTVNGLICLRQERPETFRATHALLAKWIKDGDIDGVRIDHVDGLLDPTGYLKRLRELLGEDTYIVVEKILEAGEQLPEEWPVEGTTGYDFLGFVNQVLRVEPNYGPEHPLHNLEEVLVDNKYWVLEHRMAGELDNLVHHAQGALAGLPLGADKSRLREIVGRWLSAMPVYRVYVRRGRFREEHRKILVQAVDHARDHWPEQAPGLELLRSWLRSITKLDERSATFLQRAMQLSGPLMAKGLEDTTFYQRPEALANNEVGDSPDPSRYLSIDEFHDRMVERRLSTMNATATHDTKRGEDARVVLHALDRFPAAEQEIVERAHQSTQGLRDELDEPLQQLLIKSVVAAWPDQKNFESRLLQFGEKALRESKKYSNWNDPNTELEGKAKGFLKALISSKPFSSAVDQFFSVSSAFRAHLQDVQVVLKCTCPGAPDIYQGTELPDFSLVDPDNRRPVDYVELSAVLAKAEIAPVTGKLALTHRLLIARKQHPKIWKHGKYVPVVITGEHASEVLAFRRVHGDDSALVVVAARVPPVGLSDGGRRYTSATLQLPHMGEQQEIFSQSSRTLEGPQQVSDLLGSRMFVVFTPTA